jgi:linoleate 10R-lipoxygenase
LKPYKTFLEWNPNEEVATAAKKLYGVIDHLELYAGPQAEDTNQSSMVLVSALPSLVQSLKTPSLLFMEAVSLPLISPHNLTARGPADCVRSPENPGSGSTLGRLFLRTLPEEFTDSYSICAWFLLMTPMAMDETLTELDQKEKYDFEQPGSAHSTREFKGYGEISSLFGSEDKFKGLVETPKQVDAIIKFFYETPTLSSPSSRTSPWVAVEAPWILSGTSSGLCRSSGFPARLYVRQPSRLASAAD